MNRTWPLFFIAILCWRDLLNKTQWAHAKLRSQAGSWDKLGVLQGDSWEKNKLNKIRYRWPIEIDGLPFLNMGGFSMANCSIL